jgi:hypothetical protein
MPADTRLGKLSACRAQVQTDSLTVLLDLSKASPAVAQSLRELLNISKNSEGEQLNPQEFSAFQQRCQDIFDRHKRRDLDDALEFATLISAFFHECKHVHDMRATRIGAELLLYDLDVYAGTGALLDRLVAWRAANGRKRLRLPLARYLRQFECNFQDVAEAVRQSSSKRDQVTDWWRKPSNGPTLPGHSISNLFETLGFWLQIEWLAATFGAEVADEISAATVGEDLNSQYLRPLTVLCRLCQSEGIPFDPEPHDVSLLVIAALNIEGVERAFNDLRASDRHPGTWFDHLGAHYRALSRSDLAPNQRALAAIALAERDAGYKSASEKYSAGNESIQKLQDQALSRLLPKSPMLHGEPILIASEVAIDFREMQRIIYRDVEYHIPTGYVRMLLEGALTTVYVRMKECGRESIDIRTPSWIPSNHVGGSRLASRASQQMRLLLNGRSTILRNTFFEATIYEQMQQPPPVGYGLAFLIDQARCD